MILHPFLSHVQHKAFKIVSGLLLPEKGNVSRFCNGALKGVIWQADNRSKALAPAQGHTGYSLVCAGDWNKVGDKRSQNREMAFAKKVAEGWQSGQGPNISGVKRDFIFSSRCDHEEITLTPPISARDGQHTALLVKLTPLAPTQGNPTPPAGAPYCEPALAQLKLNQEAHEWHEQIILSESRLHWRKQWGD